MSDTTKTIYVYKQVAANPFIPDGGAAEWEGNELILNDPVLRKKARVIPLDECVTNVYAYSDSVIKSSRPQLGGNAGGAPFYLDQFGSENSKPYEEDPEDTFVPHPMMQPAREKMPSRPKAPTPQFKSQPSQQQKQQGPAQAHGTQAVNNYLNSLF